jgi:hypothetical protein
MAADRRRRRECRTRGVMHGLCEAPGWQLQPTEDCNFSPEQARWLKARRSA